MIILDTNVLSALMGRVPDEHVIGWLDIQPRSSIWTTSVTILEVRFADYAGRKAARSIVEGLRDCSQRQDWAAGCSFLIRLPPSKPAI
jgi:predicted nucleic acid-binding protein